MKTTINPMINGNLKLTLDDETIYANNSVNIDALLASVQSIHDKVTGYYGSRYSVTAPFSEFSLHEESADKTFKNAYTEIASIVIDDFSIVQATLFKVTIKASGTIGKSGVIRSAGFDVIKKSPNPRTVNLAHCGRNVEIPITNGLMVGSNRNNWIYHPEKQALYYITDSTIYKIPFDIDTGIISNNMQTIITNFGTSAFVMSACDGKNLYCAAESGSATTRGLKIFNFTTETVSTVAVTGGVPFDSFAWDDESNLFRSTQGRTLSLSGILDTNQPIYDSDHGGAPTVFKKDYYLTKSQAIGRLVPFDSLGTFYSGSSYDYIEADTYIKDHNDVTVLADFNSSTPTTMELRIRQEPTTAMTILDLEPRSVSQGQTFTVEYSFEVKK